MGYIVIEIQTMQDGTVGNFVFAYADRMQAEAKYHAVLSSAAVSAVPLHAASLLQADGRLLGCESYDHRQDEVEEVLE